VIYPTILSALASNLKRRRRGLATMVQWRNTRWMRLDKCQGTLGLEAPNLTLFFVNSNIQVLVDIHLFYTLQLIFVNFHQALITFDQSGWLQWLACNYLLDAALWSFCVFTLN